MLFKNLYLFASGMRPFPLSYIPIRESSPSVCESRREKNDLVFIIFPLDTLNRWCYYVHNKPKSGKSTSSQVPFQRAAGCCEAAGDGWRNGPARANRTGEEPQYGRRSWRSVNIGPACDSTQKRARKRQAGWYRRSVSRLLSLHIRCRGRAFFFASVRKTRPIEKENVS